MTEAEQIVLLARLDDWTDLHAYDPTHKTYFEDGEFGVLIREGQLCGRHGKEWAYSDVPKFLEGLNAIRRIESRLKRSQCDDYTSHLLRILTREETIPDGVAWLQSFMIRHATASQCAEALLKTFNLWKES